MVRFHGKKQGRIEGVPWLTLFVYASKCGEYSKEYNQLIVLAGGLDREGRGELIVSHAFFSPSE